MLLPTSALWGAHQIYNALLSMPSSESQIRDAGKRPYESASLLPLRAGCGPA